MGVDRSIYTEAFFNGTWVNIDCRVLGIDDKMYLAPVMKGRSWLREALDEISNETYTIGYGELADGTKTNGNFPENTDNLQFETINYQTVIKDKIKPSPTRHGFVCRSEIAMFQTGEIDCIERWITPFDYANLDKEEQQNYSYYEWDDREGWYVVFKQIISRVDFLVDNFISYGIPCELSKNLTGKSREVKNVRLIIVIT